jgi:drug/metabolite transporter (DMT)-like permease
MVALIYGANYIISKEILDPGYVQPVGLVCLRVVFATLIFSAFSFWRVKKQVERADIPLLIVCAILGVIINQVFFMKGLKLTRPINASLIITTIPIIVLIGSAVIWQEKINIRKILGIISGLLGAIIIITYGQEVAFTGPGLIGDVMIFINAVSFGIFLVLVKKLLVKYHTFLVMAWIFAISCVVIVPLGLSEVQIISWERLSGDIILFLIYVIVLTTFVTYALNTYALKKIDPSIVGIYIYAQPFIAASLAIMLGKDQLTWSKLLAGVFIFAGVYLVSFQTSKKDQLERKICKSSNTLQ